MVNIKDKTHCCGCGACYSICPQKCIEMVEDSEGFLYPRVDEKTCINCKLCEKVCPVAKPLEGTSKQEIYAFVSKNEDSLKNSASGGFFYPLASYIIKQGGAVFGAAYNAEMKVCHQYTQNIDDLYKFEGSKYVQSDIGDCFVKVKGFLQNDKYVLFSGTPCQIQGLLKFLNKKLTEKLITLDIVCHGVPSPAVLKKYFKYLETTYGSKIVNYKFRTKRKGYGRKSYDLNFCQFNDGTQLWGDQECKYFQFMNKAFFAELVSRPSCAHCKFKNKDHVSDFTAFDCWHWKKLSSSINGAMGATSLIVNTEKANRILHAIKNACFLDEISFNKTILYDGFSMIYSIPHHPKRADFFESLHQKSIPELYEEFLELKGFDKAKFFLRKILDCVGILSFLRNLKKKYKQK